MQTNKLSARRVQTETEPGRYADGGGLYLQVMRYQTRHGDAISKSWLFRFARDGKSRQMGLGPVETYSLKEARELARQARQVLKAGHDPIEKRKAEREAQHATDAKQVTFRDATQQFLSVHEPTWKNAKHKAQWRTTLETYAFGKLASRPVSAINDAVINDTVADIWMTKPETASRVKQRIQRIVKWIEDGKPLPQPGKAKRVKHHRALPYAELPTFTQRLRALDSISARALELSILTAGRTGDVINARWDEIDMAKKVWTVPADRMKGGRDHRVPLSKRAVAILEALPRVDANVFPGAIAGKPLSNMAMLELVRGMDGNGLTVHGFRSTFRDWCAEQTNYPREVAEAALAHVLKDKVEAAYRRGDLFEKRRRLMDEWARYCQSEPRSDSKGEVVTIHGTA